MDRTTGRSRGEGSHDASTTWIGHQPRRAEPTRGRSSTASSALGSHTRTARVRARVTAIRCSDARSRTRPSGESRAAVLVHNVDERACADYSKWFVVDDARS